ncbi:MAG: hypothetical protein ACK5MU_04725 [Candidatus Saccharimonadales bacterium]
MVEIQQVGDDFFIAKGQFPYAQVDKIWMRIKKGELTIPKSVVMTCQYGSEDDTTIFKFVVATNVVEDAIKKRKAVGKYSTPLHPSMEMLHQQLINQAITALSDGIIAECDPEHRKKAEITVVLDASLSLA